LNLVELELSARSGRPAASAFRYPGGM